jgi:YVTN family beta-propeller protein
MFTCALWRKTSLRVSIALLLWPHVLAVRGQSVLETIPTGKSPCAMAVNPVTSKVYVADQSGNDVTVIDSAKNSTVKVSAGTDPCSLAVNTITNKIYVANQLDDFVTVIDGATNSTTAVTTGHGPTAVAVSALNNKIYVANLFDNTVSVIDGTTNTIIGTVPTGSYPVSIVLNPVTNKVYVANKFSNNVTVIDGRTNASSTIMAGNEPFAIAVNVVTNKIYVTNVLDNTVTVIDGRTNGTATVNTGSFPQSIAMNSTTDKIYVVNNASNTVTVIEGGNNATVTVGTGESPYDVAVNPLTNVAFVTNQGDRTITVIDGTSNSTKTVSVPSIPSIVAVNSVTDKIYVADNQGSTVSVIDGALNATAAVGTDGFPFSLAMNPVTNKLYVTNQQSADLTVVDGATNATVAVPVGLRPTVLCVNPVTNRIYVADSGNSDVSVIDGATNSLITTLNFPGRVNAIGMNPVTNKIYLTDANTDSMTVIDDATNAIALIAVGAGPSELAINEVTNKIYVVNSLSSPGTITAVDGASNTTITTFVGMNPAAIAVNSVTNRIYVSNSGDGTVTVIDGTSYTTTAVSIGGSPGQIAVNPISNKIYVANGTISSGTVTVIDGATNTTTSLNVGMGPMSIAIDRVLNKVYVTNGLSNSVTTIDGATDATTTIGAGMGPSAITADSLTHQVYAANRISNDLTVISPNGTEVIPLITSVSGIVDGQTVGTKNVFQTTNLSPSFLVTVNSAYTASSAYGAVAGAVNPLPTAVYYQIDGGSGAWRLATASGLGMNPGNFIVQLANVPIGLHALYLYAAYGDEGGLASLLSSKSPEIGNLSACYFLVVAAGNSSSIGNPPVCSFQGSPVGTTVTITTTTKISADINPAISGQKVTFTASVTSANGSNGIPNGTMTFMDGAAILGNGVLDSSGTAAFTTASLSIGTHSITATFAGSGKFISSTSATLTERIDNARSATNTTLSVDLNPAYYGQSIIVTATVAPTLGRGGSVIPTGTVTFLDGSVTLGSALLGSNGVAILSTNKMAVGNHSMTATYGGDGLFESSSSVAVVEIVAQANFALTVDPTSISLQTQHHGSIGVTLTPTGVFADTVVLSCGSLPEHVRCVFNRVGVPLSSSGGAQTVNLYLDTSDVLGYAMGHPVNTFRHIVPMAAGMIVPVTLCFDWLLCIAKRRTTNIRKLLRLSCLTIVIFGIQACSSKLPASTPPGAYSIGVRGSGIQSGVTLTVNLTLIVTS